MLIAGTLAGFLIGFICLPITLSSEPVSRHPSRVAAATIASAFLGALLAFAAAPQAPRPRPLDAKRALTYFIADGSGQAGFHADDRQLALWALEAWRRSAAQALRFEPANESTALVRLYWVDANDGQYGEMRPLTVDGRPGAAVFVQPDVESLGEDLAPRARRDVLFRDSIVYLTCLHELGHALGLAHTRDFRDIMYFFGYDGEIVEYFGRYRAQLRARNDIASVSGLSDVDVRRLRAMYPVE